jgi:hypothetical protein
MSLSFKKQSLREERYSQTTYNSMEVHMLRNLCSAALLAVMLVVLVAGNVQAQVQTTNIQATATVLTAITLTKGVDVDFGNVSATTPGVVYLNPNGTSAYVGTTAAVGTFTIAAANSQSIRLGWPTNVTLTDGTNNLNYVLEVNGYTANTQGSSALLTLTGGYKSVTTSASGAYFLWVGGKLGGSGTSPAALSSQTPAIYTLATIPFTVEYN